MSPNAKNPLPEGSQEATISALILFILDQLDRTASTPDPHYQYLRAIFQRYPLQIVIMEMRNILAALYFPQSADLAHLVMQYHGIMLVPQQKADSYYTTFIYKEAVHSTATTTTPLKSLELAQHMVDQLRAGIQLPPSSIEERVDVNTAHEEKVSTVAASSPAPVVESAPSFIRIGRIALSIDKILYIKDDSTRFQLIRFSILRMIRRIAITRCVWALQAASICASMPIRCITIFIPRKCALSARRPELSSPGMGAQRSTCLIPLLYKCKMKIPKDKRLKIIICCIRSLLCLCGEKFPARVIVGSVEV